MAYGRRTSWRSANYRYVAQPGDPPSTEPKPMKSRFAGKCDKCQGQILPGEDILWIPATRKAHHTTCPSVPTPVQATPQIACPKCGQSVYQQVSKYGKPYFTNSANRQDFHPCRVWTGRRKYPTAKALTAQATPTGSVPNAIVQAAFDAMQNENWPASTANGREWDADDRTWTHVERNMAAIDKSLAALGENTPENSQAIARLVSDRAHCLNRLALLTWERIRYDS